MGPTGCHRSAACVACISATATAVLLWGVGAESVHFRDYLPGSLLLLDALIVTLLEALTVWQYLEWRGTQRQSVASAAPPACRLSPRLLSAVDTYRRAAVYAVLSVPCFVHLRRLWLPLVPGAMLLLSAGLYLVKYCCALRRQRDIVKVQAFVRFKDESANAEGSRVSAATAAADRPAPQLSHQSSFTSSHSACSQQMGSKDSGIEASQREVAAAPGGPRKPKGLVRAFSSSPDRCCLINEDSLSLRD